nr:hypothetical protein BCU55_12365 [Shewanella sp. 10N.286.48.A6]
MLAVSNLSPLSDPENQAGWKLNQQLSDEFEAGSIDTQKWYIQGTNKEFYIWKGRAPSQFAPHNVFVEDGKLKIRTQWEPDYPFVGKPPKKQEVSRYENITTGALISHNTFLYGYMEVKVKIPDAAMTGAFWGTGFQQELDIFELIGEVKTGSKNPETTFVTSIHDWRPGHPKKNKVWKHPHPVPGRTAEHFYTYGVQWLPDGLKMFFNGELVHHATQAELGDRWVLNNPMELWFDSEVFPWHGIPVEHDLPADFEVEYVRVWQQADDSLIDRAFFGFEGPLITDAYHKPKSRNSVAKDWFMTDKVAPYLKVTDFADNIFVTGRKSLALDLSAPDKGVYTAFSPNGSLQLDEGNYRINVSIWVPDSSSLPKLKFITEAPWLVTQSLDLNLLPKGKWSTIGIPLNRSKASLAQDRLRIVFDKTASTEGFVYLDDIEIVKQ